MPQKDIYINICARIFFNTIFLAFTVFGLYLSFCDAYSYPGDYNTIFIINIVLVLLCVYCGQVTIYGVIQDCLFLIYGLQ